MARPLPDADIALDDIVPEPTERPAAEPPADDVLRRHVADLERELHAAHVALGLIHKATNDDQEPAAIVAFVAGIAAYHVARCQSIQPEVASNS